MQTIFCTECGHKMAYAGAKPKFCSSCGVSMDGKSKPNQAVPRSHGTRKSPTIREQMEQRLQGGEATNEDYSDVNYVPELKAGLQYEVSDGGFGNPIYKFEDVVDVSTEEKPEEKPKKRRGRPRKKR